MRQYLLFFLLFFAASAYASDDSGDEERLKLSQAFGHFIGKNLDTPGLKFDLEQLIQGIRDGAEGRPAPLSEEEYERLMAEYQERAYQALAEKNLDDANSFLDKNLKKAGVKEIAEGKLQYEILKEGAGGIVGPEGSPLIHFTGTLLDGTLLGSTVETGTPVEISLTDAILGFKKGIAGMKEGEKRKLWVHPDYGFKAPDNIPPNALVIFEVEVIQADTDAPEPALQEKVLSENKAQGT